VKVHKAKKAEASIKSGGYTVEDRRRQVAEALGASVDTGWDQLLFKISLAVDDQKAYAGENPWGSSE
jgi:hypothetical protein